MEQPRRHAQARRYNEERRTKNKEPRTTTMSTQQLVEILRARRVDAPEGWARVMNAARNGPVPLDRLQAWTGRLSIPAEVADLLVMSKWDTARLTGRGLAILADVEMACTE